MRKRELICFEQRITHDNQPINDWLMKTKRDLKENVRFELKAGVREASFSVNSTKNKHFKMIFFLIIIILYKIMLKRRAQRREEKNQTKN